MKNGKRVESLSVGDCSIDAHKGILIITDERTGKGICIYDSLPSAACEIGITEARTIRLDSREEMQNQGRWEAEEVASLLKRFSVANRKTGKSVDIGSFLFRHRAKFTEIKEPQKLIIFRLADSVFFWFYNNDAMGGASYAYILFDSGELSVIASGYGHYNNPALHWIDRGLSESAETEIAAEFWAEMTRTDTFHNLIAGRVFKGERWNRDGSFTVWTFAKDTLTDKDAIRLYDHISNIQEARK